MEFRTRDIYWDSNKVPDLMDAMKDRELDKDEIEFMLKEFDRRLIQFWDKVEFERKHGLVDYTKLENK